MLLLVNGEKFVMDPANVTDLDPRDGKQYAVSMGLPIGNYSFVAFASDGFREVNLSSSPAIVEVGVDPGPPANNTTVPPGNNTTVPPGNNTTVPPGNNTTVPPGNN